MWHAYGDAYIHANSNSHSNSYAYTDVDANSHSNSYAYTDSYANSHADGHCNSYGNCDCAEAFADAQAASDATPTPISSSV